MIRLSKSVVGKAEADAVAHIIEDIGYLGMGETVGQFERALEDYIGAGAAFASTAVRRRSIWPYRP